MQISKRNYGSVDELPVKDIKFSNESRQGTASLMVRKSKQLTAEMQNEIQGNYDKYLREKQKRESEYSHNTLISQKEKRVALSPWISYDLFTHCRSMSSDASTL